jgi:hypothetical protein
MHAYKSLLAAGLILVLLLLFPATGDAHGGGAMGHGSTGMGHGGGMSHHGFGPGPAWRHGWNGWSWGVPWGWSGWDYPTGWDDGGAAAWQRGYYAALQQSQWAALQQQQAQANLRPDQGRVSATAAKPNPKPQIKRPQVPAAPPIVLTPEERAAGKMKFAMLLAADGKTADAAEYYTDIVKKYPGTPAAQQAQALLKNIK